MIYSWCPIRKGTLASGMSSRLLQFLHVWLYTTAVTFREYPCTDVDP